jgi:hypothetical protein
MDNQLEVGNPFGSPPSEALPMPSVGASPLAPLEQIVLFQGREWRIEAVDYDPFASGGAES